MKTPHEREWTERITELHIRSGLFLSILPKAGVNEITEYDHLILVKASSYTKLNEEWLINIF